MIARGCCIWGRMFVPNEALDGATLCPARGVADPCVPTPSRLSWEAPTPCHACLAISCIITSVYSAPHSRTANGGEMIWRHWKTGWGAECGGAGRGGRTLSMGQGWHMSGGPQGLLAVTARKNLAGQVMMYEKLLGCGVWRRIQESSQHIGNSKRSPSMECAGVGARLVGKLPCAPMGSYSSSKEDVSFVHPSGTYFLSRSTVT